MIGAEPYAVAARRLADEIVFENVVRWDAPGCKTQRCSHAEPPPPGTATITNGHTITITGAPVAQGGGNPSTPPNICMRCHQHGFLCDCDDATPVVTPSPAAPETAFDPIKYTGAYDLWAKDAERALAGIGTVTCYFCCTKFRIIEWMQSNGRSVHGMDVCGKCLHLISVADADQ